MYCPRCKGRMFAEKYYDFVRSFDAWKCTCCGELLDSTILANRARNNNTHLGQYKDNEFTYMLFTQGDLIQGTLFV